MQLDQQHYLEYIKIVSRFANTALKSRGFNEDLKERWELIKREVKASIKKRTNMVTSYFLMNFTYLFWHFFLPACFFECIDLATTFAVMLSFAYGEYICKKEHCQELTSPLCASGYALPGFLSQ